MLKRHPATQSSTGVVERGPAAPGIGVSVEAFFVQLK